MRRISVIAVIFMFLGICGGGYAQTPVEIHTGGSGAVSNTNPLYVAGSMTLSGGALETTQLLIQGILQGLSDKTVTTTQAAQMLTQLLKLKFTGEDLKTVFSNTSIGVTATDLPLPTNAATETGNLADIKTAVEAIETRLDDMTYAESVVVERFEVSGYAETEKTYTNLTGIEVYVQTADKTVRMGIGGNDTSTNYLTIDESKALGWTKGTMRFASFPMKFKGNTETDTAIVVVQGWKYLE